MIARLGVVDGFYGLTGADEEKAEKQAAQAAQELTCSRVQIQRSLMPLLVNVMICAGNRRMRELKRKSQEKRQQRFAGSWQQRPSRKRRQQRLKRKATPQKLSDFQ